MLLLMMQKERDNMAMEEQRTWLWKSEGSPAPTKDPILRSWDNQQAHVSEQKLAREILLQREAEVQAGATN